MPAHIALAMLLAMRSYLLGLTGVAIGLLVPRSDPALEPPLRLQLRIDGQNHALLDGKTTTILLGGKQTEVRVDVDAHRHFDAGGIAFDYPRAMAFEYELDADLDHQTWTLDGDGLLILINRFATGDPDALAAAMVESTAGALDDDAPPPTQQDIGLGGKTYRSHLTTATLGDTIIHLTTVGFMADSQPAVLMLQDLRDAGEPQSDSTKRTIELLQKTFAVETR